MMRTSRLGWLIVLLPIVVIFIYERVVFRPDARWGRTREEAAKTASQQDLQVALVWPRASSSASNGDPNTPPFVNGARLAAAEINARGGVFLTDERGRRYARKLTLRYFDEDDNEAGVAIAKQIMRDPEIVATVGNRYDTSVIPASVVYNQAGVLFISPTSTNPALTKHNLEFVFRTAPRDYQVAGAMLDVVPPLVKKKRVHVALLHPQILADKLNGPTVAEVLTEHANRVLEDYGDKIDFRVVVARPYTRGQQDFQEVIRPLLQGRDLFNVILIADVLPDSLNLRLQLQKELRAVSAEGRQVEHRFLDLTSLDWGREDAYYMDFSAESSYRLFDSIARLVLWETKENAVVLASRDDLGRRLGARLNSTIVNTRDSPLNRLNLELFRLYDPRSNSFAPLVADVLDTPADFIFVAGGEAGSPELIEQMREAGVEQPIICGLDLESRLLRPLDKPELDAESRALLDEWLQAEETTSSKTLTIEQMVTRLRQEVGFDGPLSLVRGYAAEWRGKTYVASTFNPQRRNPRVENFLDDYRRTFGRGEGGPEVVDAAAAFGYFGIHVVRHAFQRSGKASPREAAVALRLYAEGDGILGENRFSATGDLLGLQFVFKHLQPNGKLQLITIPPRSTASPTGAGDDTNLGAN